MTIQCDSRGSCASKHWREKLFWKWKGKQWHSGQICLGLSQQHPKATALKLKLSRTRRSSAINQSNLTQKTRDKELLTQVSPGMNISYRVNRLIATCKVSLSQYIWTYSLTSNGATAAFWYKLRTDSSSYPRSGSLPCTNCHRRYSRSNSKASTHA